MHADVSSYWDFPRWLSHLHIMTGDMAFPMAKSWHRYCGKDEENKLSDPDLDYSQNAVYCFFSQGQPLSEISRKFVDKCLSNLYLHTNRNRKQP